MKIYIFRHGQTEFNRDSKFTGLANPKLTKTGLEDAKIVAERLKNKKIDVAFHTSLNRSKVTLKEVLKYHKECKHVFEDDRIIERDYGELNGKTHLQIVQKSGTKSYDSWHRSWDIRPPKGESFKDELKDDEVVITSDTIVWVNDEILGKPENRAEAIATLQKLSGTMHRVITAVTLQEKQRSTTFYEETEVYFKKLSDAEISFYIDNFKPFDKAGSYGIQEWIGYVGIEKINGCFYNVMGLPLFRLNQHLRALGIIEVK